MRDNGVPAAVKREGGALEFEVTRDARGLHAAVGPEALHVDAEFAHSGEEETRCGKDCGHFRPRVALDRSPKGQLLVVVAVSDEPLEDERFEEGLPLDVDDEQLEVGEHPRGLVSLERQVERPSPWRHRLGGLAGGLNPWAQSHDGELEPLDGLVQSLYRSVMAHHGPVKRLHRSVMAHHGPIKRLHRSVMPHHRPVKRLHRSVMPHHGPVMRLHRSVMAHHGPVMRLHRSVMAHHRPVMRLHRSVMALHQPVRRLHRSVTPLQEGVPSSFEPLEQVSTSLTRRARVRGGPRGLRPALAGPLAGRLRRAPLPARLHRAGGPAPGLPPPPRRPRGGGRVGPRHPAHRLRGAARPPVPAFPLGLP